MLLQKWKSGEKNTSLFLAEGAGLPQLGQLLSWSLVSPNGGPGWSQAGWPSGTGTGFCPSTSNFHCHYRSTLVIFSYQKGNWAKPVSLQAKQSCSGYRRALERKGLSHFFRSWNNTDHGLLLVGALETTPVRVYFWLVRTSWNPPP
jgi:hypothetical protein